MNGCMRIRMWLSGAVLFGSLVGCGSDHAFPVAPDIVKQYWQLSLNYHAVTLAVTAPANQLQLSAVPLTAMGDTLATEAHVHFTSSDSAVLVDSTGLLTAHSLQRGVLIIATLTVAGTQGVTLADTAKVNVNAVATVPVFTSLEVHTPGDSARMALLQIPLAPMVQMYDASGNTIANTTFYMNVQDTTVAGLSAFASGGHWGGALTGNSVGRTRLIVDAMVYGIHKSDTLEMSVGYPLFQLFTLTPASDNTANFPIQDLTISPGGVVMFENKTQDSIDVIFDDSTAAQSATYAQITSGLKGFLDCLVIYQCPVSGSSAGNILALPPLDTLKRQKVGFDFRRFSTPGSYPFHSHPFNASGVIHVE